MVDLELGFRPDVQSLKQSFPVSHPDGQHLVADFYLVAFDVLEGRDRDNIRFMNTYKQRLRQEKFHVFQGFTLYKYLIMGVNFYEIPIGLNVQNISNGNPV